MSNRDLSDLAWLIMRIIGVSVLVGVFILGVLVAKSCG